jgi:4-hydroxybenzoate polyprenyltransferase
MIRKYLNLIKFSHTIFALPFAMVGAFLGFADNESGVLWYKLVYVVLCMVFARSAAMAFNRYLDRDVDKNNPRTVDREIPSGIISSKGALAFVLINSILFVATTYFINPLCFYLSPVALLVILGYSYTKRFTSLCHIILGLGLAMAPVGAYMAVVGEFGTISVLLGFAVLFWVSGFDIIYALQDQDFDRSHSLYSIPVALGTKRSLNLSRFLHFLTIILLSIAMYQAVEKYDNLVWLSILGLGLFVTLLVYQHSLVTPTDLSQINFAFFTTNGVASVVFGLCFIIDLLLR